MILFRKHKKIFGWLGLTVIIVPVSFSLLLIKPQKAEAIVPVLDSANLKVNTEHAALTGTLVKKEFTWDTILWALAKAIIHQLTQNIVQWIRTGFEGNPLFITDPKRFFLNAVNEASGIFLDNYVSPEIYDLLCSPWRAPVFFALLTIHSQSDKYTPSCTLNTVINNAQGMANFMQNFMQGGWSAWLSMTAKPENNPYGAFLAASAKSDERKAKAEARADTEAQMNTGFLGVKTCLNRTQSGYCQEWYTDSPGKWVENQLGWSTTSELRTLELADEINEIIGALAGLIVGWMLEGIAGRTSGGQPTTPPALAPGAARQNLIEQIDADITGETSYRNIKQDSLNTYTLALGPYNTAFACYNGYITRWNDCITGGGVPSGTAPSQIQTHINQLDSQIDNINDNIIPSFNQQIIDSNTLIGQLQILRTRVETASTAVELQEINNEYYPLSQAAHDSYDQYLAGIELDNADNTLNDANWHANNCNINTSSLQCIILGFGP